MGVFVGEIELLTPGRLSVAIRILVAISLAHISWAAAWRGMGPAYHFCTLLIERALERLTIRGATVHRMGSIRALTFVFDLGDIAGRYMQMVRRVGITHCHHVRGIGSRLTTGRPHDCDQRNARCR